MNFPIITLDQLRPILVGFRKSRGLTQAALAAKLDIAQQTYAQLEANPATASVERLFRVLRVLGVELVLADAATDQARGAIVPGAPVRVAQYATPPASPALVAREPQATAASAGSRKATPALKPRKREVW